MDFGNDEGNTEKSRNTDILQNSVCMSSFTLAFIKCRPLVAFSQGKACYATCPELPHQRLISPVSYHNRMAQPRVPRCRCIPGGTTFKQANGRGNNPKKLLSLDMHPVNSSPCMGPPRRHQITVEGRLPNRKVDRIVNAAEPAPEPWARRDHRGVSPEGK